MKLTCPACGALFSLDVLLAHDGARDAVMVGLGLPAPIGKLLVQYLALFRPAKRQLSFDRVASILGELQPMIDQGKVERNGRIWSAPHDYWRMALEEMISKRDRLTLPLKSHGYLLEIIAGLGNKAEAAAEARTEAARAGHTPVGGVVHQAPAEKPAPRPRSVMPASVKEALKGGSNAADQDS